MKIFRVKVIGQGQEDDQNFNFDVEYFRCFFSYFYEIHDIYTWGPPKHKLMKIFSVKVIGQGHENDQNFNFDVK